MLKLLKIPHFGRSLEVYIVVKLSLSCVHDGYIWLESKININVDVIHRIMSLRKIGDDPSVHFVGKKIDRKLAGKLTQQLDLKIGTKAYDSTNIED